MQAESPLHIEVAYALPNKQQIVALEVEPGCTVYDAVCRSRIDQQFPGLDIAHAPLGIFGKAVAKPDKELVKDGDRIEIYRPLIADPKEVRKERAAKVKEQKARPSKPEESTE